MLFKESSIREVKAMAEFDYNALAELFPSRGRMRQRQSFGYKRFAKGRPSHPFRDGRHATRMSCGRVSRSEWAEIRQRRHQPLVQKHGLSSIAAQCTMTERRSTLDQHRGIAAQDIWS